MPRRSLRSPAYGHKQNCVLYVGQFSVQIMRLSGSIFDANQHIVFTRYTLLLICVPLIHLPVSCEGWKHCFTGLIWKRRSTEMATLSFQLHIDLMVAFFRKRVF